MKFYCCRTKSSKPGRDLEKERDGGERERDRRVHTAALSGAPPRGRGRKETSSALGSGRKCAEAGRSRSGRVPSRAPRGRGGGGGSSGGRAVAGRRAAAAGGLTVQSWTSRGGAETHRVPPHARPPGKSVSRLHAPLAAVRSAPEVSECAAPRHAARPPRPPVDYRAPCFAVLRRALWIHGLSPPPPPRAVMPAAPASASGRRRPVC